jgi:Zn-dependent M28 family amino/carboxypeptidase
MNVGNLAALVTISACNIGCSIGTRPQGLPPLTAAERESAGHLQGHVTHLAGSIGPRNLHHPETLDRAAAYIEATFARAGYSARRQKFVAASREVSNIEVERRGDARGDGVIVFGAHYDSAGDSPGANDNATGVAALLELARLVSQDPPRRTTRFVAFVNEEPPHFMTETMGSLVYASAAARRGEHIRAMISLETLGYYSDAPGSQQYPRPFHLLFPDRGNFVAMVSNMDSASLLRQVRNAFRAATSLPVIASPAPERIPGIGWSDHWSFWQHGMRAVMVTDTAPFRYPHYHTRQDTPDKIDYERLARLVTGCLGVLKTLT